MIEWLFLLWGLERPVICFTTEFVFFTFLVAMLVLLETSFRWNLLTPFSPLRLRSKHSNQIRLIRASSVKGKYPHKTSCQQCFIVELWQQHSQELHRQPESQELHELSTPLRLHSWPHTGVLLLQWPHSKLTRYLLYLKSSTPLSVHSSRSADVNVDTISQYACITTKNPV